LERSDKAILLIDIALLPGIAILGSQWSHSGFEIGGAGTRASHFVSMLRILISFRLYERLVLTRLMKRVVITAWNGEQ